MEGPATRRLTSSVPDAAQRAGGAAWGVVAWVLATFAHYVIAAC